MFQGIGACCGDPPGAQRITYVHRRPATALIVRPISIHYPYLNPYIFVITVSTYNFFSIHTCSFTKSDLLLVGSTCGTDSSGSGSGGGGQRWPSLASAREFWRPLPPLTPLLRALPSGGLRSGIAVPLPGNSDNAHFPLLVLPYVDLIEVSDALVHLVSHRPDAVVVFAPVFVIGELVF